MGLEVIGKDLLRAEILRLIIRDHGDNYRHIVTQEYDYTYSYHSPKNRNKGWYLEDIKLITPWPRKKITVILYL